MNSSLFTVGQPVVLAEAIKAEPKPGDTFPELGRPVYHVRELVERAGVSQSRWYLRLEEIRNPGTRQTESMFCERLFAPVEELPHHELEELLRESLIKPEVFA